MEQSVNTGHRKAPQTHKVSRDEFSKATRPDARTQDFGDDATDCRGQSLRPQWLHCTGQGSPAAFSVVLSQVHTHPTWTKLAPLGRNIGHIYTYTHGAIG